MPTTDAKPSDGHVPVVIIGAGPTGASAAIMLAQRGIECLVLDRWLEVYPLPRAVHFDDEVFRIFADLGITEKVGAISRPAAGMQLVDTRLRVLAEFTRDLSGRTHGYPQANMFDQPELERVLRDRLAELPSAQLRGDVEVFAIEQVPGGPAPVRVRYRDLSSGAESQVWADAVLGCDGANSITRTCIGAAMEDLGFQQQWLVVDVHSPQPLDVYDGVQQVCDHDRAATFMMVTPGRYRWEFRLRAGEQPEDLDQAQIFALIRPWLGTVDPDKLTLVRRTWYTFRGAVADRWYDRRVFLLGDAAHLTPPFIGQGMCAGIRDAANLTWKLAFLLTGQADDRLLATYETERRPYARRMVRMAILVGWLMTGGTARTARFRKAALRTLTRLPGVEQLVLHKAWPAFPAGPLTARADRAAGRICPQPRLRAAGGDVLLDQALGDRFAIISRSRGGVSAFDPPTRDFFDALGTSVLHLGDLGAGGATDLDGTLTALLDRTGADALLLRPDRVIAASARRAGLRRWRHLLESAGITAA
ncbi:bifunctional 3-(3-hydroxy-phenyl)propionate/3-hydroxycinnamic acid hydroxylase [Micromonospora sp. CPCC 205371]|nr:bifunctional 3-(3-hydroxy-phenyl)propionate/3-hydroxycinnamic acid hydroxylase [Micromonospora sp. CPCC 205371]